MEFSWFDVLLENSSRAPVEKLDEKFQLRIENSEEGVTSFCK